MIQLISYWFNCLQSKFYSYIIKWHFVWNLWKKNLYNEDLKVIWFVETHFNFVGLIWGFIQLDDLGYHCRLPRWRQSGYPCFQDIGKSQCHKAFWCWQSDCHQTNLICCSWTSLTFYWRFRLKNSSLIISYSVKM